jgi:hypothetical protein
MGEAYIKYAARRSERKLRSPWTPSKGLFLFSGDISLPFSEVTDVLFKMKNKGPRVQGSKGSSAMFLFLIVSLDPLTPRILES